MIKYLITGSSGFVGKYFTKHITRKYSNIQIFGIDTEEAENKHINFSQINMLDLDTLSDYISSIKPNYILHLASYSSVAYSWKNPVSSFSNNTNIFLNLLESIRRANIKARLISVGSSEEYGNLNPIEYPLDEKTNLNPISPYAVARVSQEMLSKVYCNGYAMDIIMTRSFNHIGPKQSEIFVVPSFVKQFANAKKNNKKELELITGDVTLSRDFLDVRDVVEAYDLLFYKGLSGEIYNICSGYAHKIIEIINILSSLTGIKVNINVSDKLLRPAEIKKVVGSNKKIIEEVGWIPKMTLKDSLADMLESEIKNKPF
jgi:GDP-4-dehydro-6-deoxy-D-mannose reductase